MAKIEELSAAVNDTQQRIETIKGEYQKLISLLPIGYLFVYKILYSDQEESINSIAKLLKMEEKSLKEIEKTRKQMESPDRKK